MRSADSASLGGPSRSVVSVRAGGQCESAPTATSCPNGGSACEEQAASGDVEYIWPASGSSTGAAAPSSSVNLAWTIPSELAVFEVVVRSDADPFLASHSWYLQYVEGSRGGGGRQVGAELSFALSGSPINPGQAERSPDNPRPPGNCPVVPGHVPPASHRSSTNPAKQANKDGPHISLTRHRETGTGE